MINLETVTDNVFLVVITLDQRITRHVVLALNLRGVVDDVVSAAGDRVNAAAADAAHDLIIRHGDFEHEVDRNTGLLQGFGLRNRAGEAVEQETVLAVRLRETFFHEPEDDVVAHQSARFHDGLRLEAERGSRLHSRAKHVAGGNLGDREAFLDEGSLGALSGAGRSDQNKTHIFISKTSSADGSGTARLGF